MLREQMVELRAMERTRARQAALAGLPDIIASVAGVVAFLTEGITVLDRDLEQLTQEHAAWQEVAEVVRAVPGVGPVVTHTLVAYLPELGHLSGKKIASLAGLAPHPNDSGPRSRPRVIQGGRALVRQALYMAAFTALRRPGIIGDFFRRLRAAGKPYKVAMTACMRKLLVVLNAKVAARLGGCGPGM